MRKLVCRKQEGHAESDGAVQIGQLDELYFTPTGKRWEFASLNLVFASLNLVSAACRH